MNKINNIPESTEEVPALEIHKISNEELSEVLGKIERLEAFREAQKNRVQQFVKEEYQLQKNIADLESLIDLLLQEESPDTIVFDDDSVDLQHPKYTTYRTGRNVMLGIGGICLLGAGAYPVLFLTGGMFLFASVSFHICYRKFEQKQKREDFLRSIMEPNQITNLKECKLVLHQKKAEYEQFLDTLHEERSKLRQLEEQIFEANFLKSNLCYEQRRRENDLDPSFEEQFTEEDALDMGAILLKIKRI